MTLRQRGVLGTRTLKGETVMAAAKGGQWCSAMATRSRHCALSPSYRRRERGGGQGRHRRKDAREENGPLGIEGKRGPVK
jgi:hypothetical protein